MGDYYCPNCGADLEDQYGFDPNNGYWTCTECGKLLTDPDDPDFDTPSGATWFCDGCGACLNKQSGFSEYCYSWYCTECGYDNKIDESEIYDSEEDYQRSKEDDSILGSVNSILDSVNNILGAFVPDDDEDDDDEDDDDYDDDDDYYGSSDSEDEYDDSLDGSYQNDIKIQKKSGILKRIWRSITGKKFRIGVSANDCLGVDTKIIVDKLQAAEFENIQTIQVDDLDIDRIGEEGTVKEISVDGNPRFNSNDLVPYNAEIVVYFHMLKKTNLPMSSRKSKGKNYSEVVGMYRNAGFVYIEEEPIYDLTFGWLKKDGSVESVTINRNAEYKQNDLYRIDAKVVVKYHSLKKNRR